MFRRLFLVFFPTFTASVSLAEQASWNCEQNKETKEWVCVGESKQNTKSLKTAPPIESKPVKAINPVLTGPIEKKPLVKPQTRQASAPQMPEPARPNQPMIPAPVRPAQAVAASSKRTPPPAQSASNQIKKPVSTEAVKSNQLVKPTAPKTAEENSKVAEVGGSPPGWKCEAGNKDENWNCQLVGTAPKGNTEALTVDKPSISLLTPAFDHQQEQIFSTLTSQLKYDPWESCSVEPGIQRDTMPPADLRDVSPLDVKSNYAEIIDNEIGSYSGNVKITRADQQASSNAANYDSVSEVLDLHGNVYYSEEELALSSESATLNLASDQAKLRDVQFITPSAPLRGRADAVFRDSKTLSRYKRVAYTSCRPGNQDWVVHASELKLNKITGRGAAKNSWIEFKGVPVFYSPYLSFPIDNRRTSGFLAPVFGSTQKSGVNLSAPYYWNIAPNYDATIMPRYLTKRGALLGGKFRYLTENSLGNVVAEVMPNDSQTHTTRFLGRIQNSSQITSSINSNLDLNYVSDRTYFSELGNALSFANFNYLRSTADVNYGTPGVSLSARAENYQSINEQIKDVDLPYRKLPQINLNLEHAFKFMPLHTAMENEYVYFQHNVVEPLDSTGQPILDINGQPINAKPSGQRLNFKPILSVPLQTAGSFFTPRVSLQHTQYFLNNGQPYLNRNNQQLEVSDTTISRTLPIFSADSGLFFERDLDIVDTKFLHTLEPRLFYLYIPYTNQNDIPLFDSAQYDFNYYSMFRENSFSGTDRIQDANQITTALTTRLIDDKENLERLRLSIGEIFYFRDRLVTIPDTPIQQTGSFSNLVTEVSSELTRHLSTSAGLQWNPELNEIQRVNTSLHYGNESNELINLGFVYRNNPLIEDGSNDITQSDFSFRWPIYDKWYAIGRWQYSWLYDTTQDGLFGLEKENCCWRIRVFGRHYINNLYVNNGLANVDQRITGTAQNGIFFQIELKGFTGIGDNLDNFLQQTIFGYRKTQNDW